MVTGTNSTPTGIPDLGCGEDGSFIQLRFRMAAELRRAELALGRASLQPDSSARLTPQGFGSCWELSLRGVTDNVLLSPRGAGLDRQKPPPRP